MIVQIDNQDLPVTPAVFLAAASAMGMAREGAYGNASFKLWGAGDVGSGDE